MRRQSLSAIVLPLRWRYRICDSVFFAFGRAAYEDRIRLDIEAGIATAEEVLAATYSLARESA